MKKQFITGFVGGAVIFGAIGALAATYVATDNPFPVKLNGNDVQIQGYNIEGSTYFKLRDVADAVGGFEVGFEDNTILLEKSGYTNVSSEKAVYNIGDTWTVDGQWSLTIDSVTATNDRNEFSDKNPAAVYVVDYTYTNLGYVDSNGIMDGLFLTLDDSIIDSAGFMGYSYPGNIDNYPKETPVGATCKAQACIGVDNAGDFTLRVNQYDGNVTEQLAEFNVAVQ